MVKIGIEKIGQPKVKRIKMGPTGALMGWEDLYLWAARAAEILQAQVRCFGLGRQFNSLVWTTCRFGYASGTCRRFVGATFLQSSMRSSSCSLTCVPRLAARASPLVGQHVARWKMIHSPGRRIRRILSVFLESLHFCIFDLQLKSI